MNPTTLLSFLFAQTEKAGGGPMKVKDAANEVNRAAQNLKSGQGSPIPYLTDQQWADLQGHLMDFAFDCLGAIAILIIGWLIARWLGGLARKLLSKQPQLDITVSLLISRIVRWAVLLLAVAAVAQLFGLGASMFAAIGAAGLAIALALQGTMSNVASGVMLLVTRPFNVGDAVKIGGDVYVVDEIGLFAITAHLPDGPRAVIPNTKTTSAEIINYGICHDDVRRLDLTACIGYDDDIEQAMEVLNGVLDREPRVLETPERLLAVSEMADSSVNLLVRAWTKRADWWGTKCDLTKEIKLALDHAGISIPFPQQDVHVISGSYTEDDETKPTAPKNDPKQLSLVHASPAPAKEEPMTEAKRWTTLRLPASG